MPKVSVVIPTYNRANFLPECLNSVLAQSFGDYEIIVVDDGSVDNTYEVVSKFPVKYLYQENQGAPTAINNGIAVAKGEYIAYLDSDDVLLASSFQKELDMLEAHPEAGFCYGQAYIMDVNGKIRSLEKGGRKNSGVIDGKEEIGALIYGNCVSSPHTMIRRRCLEEVGNFNPAFKQGSLDYELWVRLAKKYAVAYLAEPIMKWRRHSDTITGQRNIKEMEKTRSIILESVFNDTELGPLFSPQRPQAYFYLYFNLANDAYDNKEMIITRNYLIKALRTCPRLFFTRMWPSWISRFTITFIPRFVLVLFKEFKATIWRKMRLN